MACPRCGSATRPGQKFCAECGLALGGACPNCLGGLPSYGAWYRLAVRSLKAGGLALEGRVPESLSEYRAVIEEWRAHDLRFDLAMTLIHRARLLGEHDAEAAAGLDEARSILAGMGAEGLIERLTAAAAGAAHTAVSESVR